MKHMKKQTVPATFADVLGIKMRKLAIQCLMASASAAFVYALPVADSALQLAVFNNNAVAAEAERRPPPETRASETLTRKVYERVEQVMTLRDAEDYAGARVILDEIKDMYTKDQLNNREKQVLFQFYANLDQIQENYPAALASYQEILKIPELGQEVLEQTWTQVGSLYYIMEQYREAISAFETLNGIALEPDDDIYLRMAYAYYQLEEYSNAIVPLLKNFEIMRAKGEMIPKNSYGLLRALYLTLEDYEKGYQVVRESLVLYNDPQDWVLLAQLAAQLERFDEQARLYYASGTGNYLESDSDFVTLASLLNNNDNPYGCAEVMAKALEAGKVEEDEDNLSLTATCYRLAREDAKAIPYLEKAAEISETGELYAGLARVYMTLGDYEAAEATFKKAFEKGDMNRIDQVHLLRARNFLELNQHDQGIEAARNAARDSRSADTAQTWITHLANEKERYETLQRQRTELAEYFR